MFWRGITAPRRVFVGKHSLRRENMSENHFIFFIQLHTSGEANQLLAPEPQKHSSDAINPE
jgi:hypothetical protein